MSIDEADWQHLRRIKPAVLDRLCERILSQIARASRSPGKTNHERYLAVFKLIQRRDDDIADAFNDMRRSTAYQRIFAMHKLKLLTVEEIAGFSARLRAFLEPESPSPAGEED